MFRVSDVFSWLGIALVVALLIRAAMQVGKQSKQIRERTKQLGDLPEESLVGDEVRLLVQFPGSVNLPGVVHLFLDDNEIGVGNGAAGLDASVLTTQGRHQLQTRAGATIGKRV